MRGTEAIGKLSCGLAAAVVGVQFIGGTAGAATLELFDRDPAAGTQLAGFSVYMTDPTPNGTFSDASSLLDSDSQSGSITRGYPSGWNWITPSSDTYARSTVDFTNGRISSELKYNYTSPVAGVSNDSRVDVYTEQLPSSYSLTGSSGSYNSRFIIQVYDRSSGNLGQLGFMILSLMNGSYQQHVTSLNDPAHETPLYDWEWISVGELPTSEDLASHVNWIVNGRSSEYYYQIAAEVNSSDMVGGEYTAMLQFGNSVPEPAALVTAALMGGALLARRSKGRRSHA